MASCGAAQHGDAPPRHGGGPPPQAPPATTVRVPDGAIRVEPDLYMVPLPKPVAGCPAFRPFSRTRKVPQAIYWRGVDGGFVRDRNKARCDGPPKRH